jgi:DNA-binding MarR family transcriptional regulator
MAVSNRQEFLERQPTYWIKRSYIALRRRVDSELRHLGITLSQRDALLTLRHSGPMSMNALSDALGLEQSSVSRLVLGLSRRGLLELREDRKDRRMRHVSITDRGAELLAQTPGSSSIASGILAKALDPSETEQLLRLLRKATVQLESLATTNHHQPEE